MTSIRETLKDYGVYPYRGRGQHFLINNDVADRIVDLADIDKDDIVVEIGPGVGALTGILLERSKRLVAIESDRKLSSLISEKFDSEKLEVVLGDALKFDYNDLGERLGERFVVVSNLPYNISTEMIFRLLSARGYIKRAVLMLQREVAMRLCASPSTKNYGVITVLASLYCDMSIGLNISRGNFFPRPKVDSAVVVFNFRNEPFVDVGDEDVFRRVVRAAFWGRRKTLRNSLKSISDIIPASDIGRLVLKGDYFLISISPLF
jgi:16S rRNA (adenine1518-N6/adenine1519-N6)-dimethyltransferase